MLRFLFIGLSIVVPLISCADPRMKEGRSRDELDIRMERKGCYGQCPMYVLNVRPDGIVIFDGKGYTKVIGRAESRITQSQLDDLLSEVRNTDIFGLRDSYKTGADGCPSEATDMPSVVLSIRLNDREKNIFHYHGCLEASEWKSIEPGTIRQAERLQPYPRALTRFEERVDEIVGTQQWVGDSQ
jgi:hypothetical protein